MLAQAEPVIRRTWQLQHVYAVDLDSRTRVIWSNRERAFKRQVRAPLLQRPQVKGNRPGGLRSGSHMNTVQPLEAA